MMDCRETRTLLIAFHDGELPAADRAQVEAHLRGCVECRALLTDLARADKAAGVPDPGSEYWSRFNARVLERVESEADGRKVALLRPKQGWMRQQFRYLVPAVAAAALVVVVVRYAGIDRGGPAALHVAPPALQAVSPPEIASPSPLAPLEKDKALRRESWKRNDREPVDHGSSPSTPVQYAEGNPPPPPALSSMPARPPASLPAPAPASAPAYAPAPPRENEAAARADAYSRDQAAAGANVAAYSERKAESMARAKSASPMFEAAPPRPPSFCDLARKLAAEGKLKEAESAQRACLDRDQAPATQETGMVFLAELLDRQARFEEADAVIEEARRQFPRSRPLDLYRQQRPMVQQQSPEGR